MQDLDKPNALEKFAPDCLCSCGEPDWFREQRGLLRRQKCAETPRCASTRQFIASTGRFSTTAFHDFVESLEISVSFAVGKKLSYLQGR